MSSEARAGANSWWKRAPEPELKQYKIFASCKALVHIEHFIPFIKSVLVRIRTFFALWLAVRDQWTVSDSYQIPCTAQDSLQIYPEGTILVHFYCRPTHLMSRLVEAGVAPRPLERALAKFILSIIVHHAPEAKYYCNKDPYALGRIEWARQLDYDLRSLASRTSPITPKCSFKIHNFV